MDEILKKKKIEEFHTWVKNIPTKVMFLRKNVPKNVSECLDYSLDSLNVLEKYLLDNFTIDTLEVEENMYLVDSIAGYIGDTFVKNVKGGGWAIDYDDKSFIYYSLPFVLPPKNGVAMSPHRIIRTIFYKNKYTFLYDIFRIDCNSDE